jgi:hypothetical protein
MKKLLLIIALISYQINAQSLIEDRDESVYIKGNSNVYIGLDTQRYAYTVTRYYNENPGENGLVSGRTTEDTATGQRISSEYYRYTDISKDKVETYDLYRDYPQYSLILSGWQTSRDQYNLSRIGHELYYHKDLDHDSIIKYIDKYVYVRDIYSYTNNKITGVDQELTDYYFSPAIVTAGESIRNIVWLDYEKEIKKTYEIKRGDQFNKVFFNYKDGFGSYDKTERELIGGTWHGVRRETRNFDSNGLNSIAKADSSINGWIVKSKILYTYEGSNISSITKILSEGDSITYIEREVFDGTLPNLRKSQAKEYLVLDDRDIENTTGIESFESGLSIFPNPAVNSVNISGMSQGEKIINLINAQGVVSYTFLTQNPDIKIDVLPGVYSVQIMQSSNTKIVKNLVVL